MDDNLFRAAAIATVLGSLVAVLGFFGLGWGRSEGSVATTTTTSSTVAPTSTSHTATSDVKPSTTSGSTSTTENTPPTVEDEIGLAKAWPECGELPLLPKTRPSDASTAEGNDGCPVTTGPFSVTSASKEIEVELLAGQTVAVTVSTVIAIGVLEVFDPQGTSIHKDNSIGAKTHTFTARTAGTYTVSVTPDREGGATYSIRLLDVS